MLVRELDKALENKAETTELTLYDYLGETFPTEIYELENLETLYFKSNTCWSIPEGISRCSRLKNLRIECSRIKELPADIGGLTQLSKLTVVAAELQKLPESWSLLTQVQQLTLLAAALPALVDMSQWEKMEKATIVCKLLKQLPDMRLWQQLQQLSFFDAQVTEIAAYVFELPQLKELLLSNNKIKELPENFYKAAGITKLGLEGNPLSSPPVSVIYMDNLWSFSCESLGFPRAFSYNQHCYDFFREIRKAASPKEYRLSLYHIFCNNTTEIPQIPSLHLAEALRINYKDFYLPALAELSRRAQNDILPEHSPKKGDEIAVLGKISFKKTELKERLKKLDIKYVNAITETTRYAVLGANIEDVELLKTYKLFFLTDRDLDVFFQKNETHFLLASSAEEAKLEQQNLSQMLLSRQSDSVELAVQLLKTGGVPKNLITDLFLVVKDPAASDKARKMAKHLLELNASPTLVSRIGEKRQLFLLSGAEESTLDNNLSHYASGTELDSIHMAIYLYQQTGLGYRHWLRLSPPEKRREVLSELFKNPKFILRFYDCYCINSDLFPYADIITRFNFDGNGNRVVPKEVYALPNLEYLGLKENCIKKFKPEFAKLSKLRELNLSFLKSGEDFPEVFIQMPHLQRIVVEGCLFISTSDSWKPYYRLDTKFPKTLVRL